MPLQPRRTWSAEDERRRRLEEDPDAYDVGPHTVTCAGCHRPIRLNATGRYYAANWNKHKMGCKNTNAANGASAVSAESKFTGRVAAFRVAKPAESSEPFTIPTKLNTLTSQESRHLPAHVLYPSSHRLDGTERTDSWSDHFPAKGLSSVGEHGTASTSYRGERSGMSRRSANDHSTDASDKRAPIALTHSDTPKAQVDKVPESPTLSGMRRQLRSPTGPLSRVEEQEAYGSMRTPLRGERERYGQSPHAIQAIGPQRKEPSPLHHSEDAFRHDTHQPPLEAPPKFQRVLDKGKDHHIEHTSPHVLQRAIEHKHQYLAAEFQRRGTPIEHVYAINRTSNIDSIASQERSSGLGRQAHRPRVLAERGFVSDFGSDSAASSPEFSASRLGRSLSNTTSAFSDSTLQAYSRLDDRVLPPLSSLSLTHRANSNSSVATLEKPTHHNSQNEERHNSSSLGASLDRSPLWRERTHAWVQAGSAWSGSDREAPESVVLPPIRATLDSPPSNAPGTRRRQREADGSDDSSMDEDRPSPPKVFVVPMNASRTSSTPRADDLSLTYKPKRVSSDEDANVGGDSNRSTFVGNQSERNESIAKGSQNNIPRLHPVWKWERSEDVPRSRGLNSENDVLMS
ncbi:uncharacterized protein FOMMEDRAFT_170935 [Fomitiporia mediterranea MF3/22]|uniref:uncharacterized protein n=1 Tax=Fomitiporia mediterranea (strain MF3/22) TaxID=694068 RepID=UPI00044089CC|nr:uncharacterized protein FOMMEDRAFT_170935 [Fomitiporia mediterranea MF3/22]EJC98723.1 hypothetical protein FOMMEDRAFT_170935 [Fomitiporia mediterranea MF3/22]